MATTSQIQTAPFLQRTLWNANGLSQHALELQSFLTSRNIDIMLLSEIHFTLKSYLRIPHYTIYHTNHPAGTAREGIAIIIKNVIKHHPLSNYSRYYLQATSVSVEGSIGHLTITIKIFLLLSAPRFIAGGDYSAKHTDWGSRLITPRGREVLKTLESNNSPLHGPPYILAIRHE
jgi:hypothetical protein